jgi:ankyrin repeat protein
MNYRRFEADQAYGTTCAWILQHDAFLTWKDSERGLLWVKGPPGSGKSTLMAYLGRQYLDGLKHEKRILLLTVFFHGRGTELQNNPIGMFRQLIHQLYEKVASVRKAIRQIYQRKVDTLGRCWEWQLVELQNLFTDAIMAIPNSLKLVILVDALDEVDKGADTVIKYLHFLNDKVHRLKISARICVSCRDYLVTSRIPGMEIHIEKENHADICNYVRYSLQTMMREVPDEDDKKATKFLNDIVKHSNGIFQWAALVAPMVEKRYLEGESWASLERFLREVPEKLHALYEDILQQQLEWRSLSKSLYMLQWICLSKRPLSVEELQFALLCGGDVEPEGTWKLQDAEDYPLDESRMSRLITTLSGGLAEVRIPSAETDSLPRFKKQKYVQFIHQSVQNFMVTYGLNSVATMMHHSSISRYTSHTQDPNIQQQIMLCGHQRILNACINHFKLDSLVATGDFEPFPHKRTWGPFPQHSFGKHSDLLTQFPLLEYATEYWIAHAEEVESRGFIQPDLKTIMGYPHSQTLGTWLRCCKLFPGRRYFYGFDGVLENFDYSEESSLLHIASGSRLPITVKDLIQTKTDDPQRLDRRGRSAIHYAAFAGEMCIMKALLETGVDIANMGDAWNFQHPLYIATTQGHTKVTNLLLQYQLGKRSEYSILTPLLQAAVRDGTMILLAALLEAGPNLNAQVRKYGSVLQAAALESTPTAVEMLLKAGAEVNAVGGIYGNALQAAAVDCLIPTSQESPLPVAYVMNFHKSHPRWQMISHLENSINIIGMLLKAGADINALGGIFGTALQAACVSRNELAVKMLLGSGADVNIVGGRWGNALNAAAELGSEAIVRVLLDAGADVKIRGATGGNIVLAAARRGSELMMRLLLDAGAEVNSQIGPYGHPLVEAAVNGHETAVRLLLQAGADSNVRGGRCGNALQAAVRHGSIKILEQLLRAGADPNANPQGNGNDNVLNVAVELCGFDGRKSSPGNIVRLLLSAGANTNAQGKDGKDALNLAIGQNQPEIARLLLRHGAEIHPRHIEFGYQRLGWRGKEIFQVLTETAIQRNIFEELKESFVQAESILQAWSNIWPQKDE